MTNRELDILVSEKVFGIKVTCTKHKRYDVLSLGEPYYFDSQGCLELGNPLPLYSECIEDAWSILLKLQEEGKSFTLSWDAHELNKNFIMSNYQEDLPNRGWYGTTKFELEATTAPRVICLAALRTMGVKVENFIFED